MPTFSPRDVHIPEDGQTVITLLHPYVVGAEELIVYLNGLLVTTPQDYIETDNLTITFNFQLSADDVVITQHLVYYEDKLVRVISDGAKALFSRYGTEERLMASQKYSVRFRYGDKEFDSSFYTPISPMYVPVATIRSDLGEFIKKISDFQISYMIYQNSLFAQQIFDDVWTVDATTGVVTPVNTNGIIPFKVRQFVRYRTEVDLATQIYLTLMGTPSSDHFVLGQLEVEKRFNLGDYKPLIDMLKAELTKYARTKSPLRTAVKGGTDAFTLTTPRNGMDSVFTS